MVDAVHDALDFNSVIEVDDEVAWFIVDVASALWLVPLHIVERAVLAALLIRHLE